MIQEPKASDTRHRVLALIAREGPITAAELAERLKLTPAGVRRHLTGLEDAGLIIEHRRPSSCQASATPPALQTANTSPSPGGGLRSPGSGLRSPGSGLRSPGRPSRRYVTTASGQQVLGTGYRDLAIQALEHVQQHEGAAGMNALATERAHQMEERYSQIVDQAGSNPLDRAECLAQLFTHDGHACTLRPGPTGRTWQLCQGHCPVQLVAELFPMICQAETAMIGRLLGVPVQQLATLAQGGHVCTTIVSLPHSPVGAS